MPVTSPLKTPLPPGRRQINALFGIAGVLGLWAILTYGNVVTRHVLPTPGDVLVAFPRLHFDDGLVRAAAWSFYRITVAFLCSAAVAVPLGIWAGWSPGIKAIVWPIAEPLRYLPIAAVVPLTIYWFGIGENQKIALLFIGTVVYLYPLVVEAVENVEKTFLETAATLGATSGQIVRNVLVPIALPAIFEGGRVVYGIGWTYVILAEVINAEYGLGYIAQIASKRGQLDRIFAIVIVILLLGFLTDAVFARVNRLLFSWNKGDDE
jgi:NitT/TauT family transport system permease protein